MPACWRRWTPCSRQSGQCNLAMLALLVSACAHTGDVCINAACTLANLMGPEDNTPTPTPPDPVHTVPSCMAVVLGWKGSLDRTVAWIERQLSKPRVLKNQVVRQCGVDVLTPRPL